MFYYYGAKNMLAKHYPEPAFDLIIEPFAGSAAYSCYHLLRDKSKRALLIDKDRRVADTWEFLLSASATKEDIIDYPVPEVGQHSTDFFVMTCAASNAVSRCKKLKFSKRISEVFELQRNRILKLWDIRERITFIQGDYTCVDNQQATWFIDPPYQVLTRTNKTHFPNGEGYSNGCSSSDMDYLKLAGYCKEREGQLIVCEKEGANWLEFGEFVANKTSLNKKYQEVIYLQ